MRNMLGCASLIAAVAYLLGLIGVQFATQLSITGKLLMALMPAGMAFIAVIVLCGLDRLRYHRAMRTTTLKLLKRVDISDGQYTSQLPGMNNTLSIQTRNAVAELFQVPPTKIGPADNLRSDLRFDTLLPMLFYQVVPRVLASQNKTPDSFHIHLDRQSTMGDLTREIQRIIDDSD